jgi:hypothetical protein
MVGLQYCSNLIDGVAGWASACISSIPACPAMQGPVWGSAGVCVTTITVTTLLLARQKAVACPEELDTGCLPWPRCEEDAWSSLIELFQGRTGPSMNPPHLISLIIPHYIMYTSIEIERRGENVNLRYINRCHGQAIHSLPTFYSALHFIC